MHTGEKGTVSAARIRPARAGDEPGAYRVCLLTGHNGENGEPFYGEDPDALGRIFVGPYLAFEPDLSFVLEDEEICGYVLGALDSRAFYRRYEEEWRPGLCGGFAAPQGNPATWTPVQRVYHAYHRPDYFCPDPYDEYPSHAHIDLLPRAQGRGHGRRMMDRLLAELRGRGSGGVHLGVSALNTRAQGFYAHLGFRELTRTGSGDDACVYMGLRL
ncbi:MAG TPA: GNAT family N-acetyltransferase [Vicinamibacterales bacterium]|nr:GNAT family N-acetyltransferase [Vicinamibacterales bacterium]